MAKKNKPLKLFYKILIIYLSSSVWVNAQTNDNIVPDTADLSTVRQRALAFKKDLAAKSYVQQAHFDTIDNRKLPLKEQKFFIPDPNKSMWYALICPGLGQIYNRRYWKLPIVYGGFVGLAYGISSSAKNYNLYRRAYIASQNNDYSWNDRFKNLNESTLKTRMDGYRRNRDLCIIGVVAFYGITVLDAFVDAALADFDISPDLSMKIVPKVIQNQENTYLAMQINFKF